MESNESQNGHYESRRHLATRYSEENCHCQCVGCNVFGKGNMTVYAINLEKQYGQGILQKLKKETRKTTQNSRKLYEDVIIKYKKY